MQQDILSSLQLRDPQVLQTSFNRPNISYAVLFKDAAGGPAAAGGGEADGDDSFGQLVALLHGALGVSGDSTRGCAIVYALKRKSVAGLALRLAAAGFACGAYHAGMPARERAATLERWRGGALAVCVATVAFGMGVDKPDGGSAGWGGRRGAWFRTRPL